MRFTFIFITMLMLRTLVVYGDGHLADPEGEHPVLEEEPIEVSTQRAIDQIEKSVDKDTQLLKILVRVDKKTAERLALASIALMLKNKDPKIAEQGRVFESQLRMAKAGVALEKINLPFFGRRRSDSEPNKSVIEKKKYDAIALGLLENFIEIAKDSPKKFTAGYNTTGVKITTVKASPSRFVPDSDFNTHLKRFPEGISSGQLLALMEMETKFLWYKPTIEKHPVELVLQILEEDPAPLKIGGYYHALIDIKGSDGSPTVETKFNTRWNDPRFKNEFKAKSRLFTKGPTGNDGLLSGYTDTIEAMLQALPPEPKKEPAN